MGNGRGCPSMPSVANLLLAHIAHLAASAPPATAAAAAAVGRGIDASCHGGEPPWPALAATAGAARARRWRLDVGRPASSTVGGSRRRSTRRSRWRRASRRPSISLEGLRGADIVAGRRIVATRSRELWTALPRAGGDTAAAVRPGAAGVFHNTTPP